MAGTRQDSPDRMRTEEKPEGRAAEALTNLNQEKPGDVTPSSRPQAAAPATPSMSAQDAALRDRLGMSQRQFNELKRQQQAWETGATAGTRMSPVDSAIMRDSGRQTRLNLSDNEYADLKKRQQAWQENMDAGGGGPRTSPMDQAEFSAQQRRDQTVQAQRERDNAAAAATPPRTKPETDEERRTRFGMTTQEYDDLKRRQQEWEAAPLRPRRSPMDNAEFQAAGRIRVPPQGPPAKSPDAPATDTPSDMSGIKPGGKPVLEIDPYGGAKPGGKPIVEAALPPVQQWQRVQTAAAVGGWDPKKGSFGGSIDWDQNQSNRLKTQVFDPVQEVDKNAIKVSATAPVAAMAGLENKGPELGRPDEGDFSRRAKQPMSPGGMA